MSCHAQLIECPAFVFYVDDFPYLSSFLDQDFVNSNYVNLNRELGINWSLLKSSCPAVYLPLSLMEVF